VVKVESILLSTLLIALVCFAIWILCKIFVSNIKPRYDNVEIILQSDIPGSSYFKLKWREKIYGIWTFESTINKTGSYDSKAYYSFDEAREAAYLLLRGDNLKKTIESRKLACKRIVFNKNDALIKDIIE
jgi:hypothetical protein